MIVIECQPNTPAWYEARAGKITASRFADAVSVCKKASGKRKVGDPSATSDGYAADVVMERLSGKPKENVTARVLERGHDLEPVGRRKYEARTKYFVSESGVCVTDDGLFGYSTDGLVERDGLIEIKCPVDNHKILEIWRTGDISEYMHQMQGGMWITGRRWCDFIMYVPDLESMGKDLYVQRVMRDDVFIDDMVLKLARFAKTVETWEALMRVVKAPAATPPAPVEIAVPDWKKPFLTTQG
jgi:exodeoxyribonuclease (lambda-induced)